MDYKEVMERMNSGKLFYFAGEELSARQTACLDVLYDFNQTRPFTPTGASTPISGTMFTPISG